MPIIDKARRPCESYGHAIGILVLDIDCPYVPGNVGNARTFSYPVLYQAIRGCAVEQMLFQSDPRNLAQERWHRYQQIHLNHERWI